jgi:hypothetical protein
MTAETVPGQAGATTGGPAGSGPARQARPPGLPDRMVRYGIWLAVVTRSLGDRRFQASVITCAIGAYALASLIKNNEARPVRRAAAWYERLGDARDIQKLHRAPRAPKPDRR